MIEDDFDVVRGRGNIHADFGDPDAETKHLKAYLAAEIISVLDRRSLTVRAAAKITSIPAADISRIRNADLGRFTMDRLVRVLAHLDRRVTLTVNKIEGTEAA